MFGQLEASRQDINAGRRGEGSFVGAVRELRAELAEARAEVGALRKVEGIIQDHIAAGVSQ